MHYTASPISFNPGTAGKLREAMVVAHTTLAEETSTLGKAADRANFLLQIAGWCEREASRVQTGYGGAAQPAGAAQTG
jgi:hypothetical protein